MSDSTPVAATIEEIEAAFPKMKPSTVLACLKAKKPLASVAQAAVEEMMAENQEMAAKCKAMEEELAKYKSMEPSEEEPAEAMEEEMVETKATARGGVKPIAKAKTGASTPSARVRWNEAIQSCMAKARNDRAKATQLANRENPGLREAMLAEINAR